MNPAMQHLPRWRRRQLLDEEAHRRKTVDWGAWEVLPANALPEKPRGWGAEVTTVYRNKVFAVLVRPIPAGLHLAVSSLSGIRPSWHEMQRIKNDVLGPDATAVEVYPPASQVVDGADMFHIWAVGPLPFSLFATSRSQPQPPAARTIRGLSD